MPKQIEKDEFQPFRLRRAAIEAKLSQKETNYDKKAEEFDERNFRFAGEEKMGVVIGGNESGKEGYNDVDVILAKNAQISETSRGDFTLRNAESSNRNRKKELINVEIPDTMIFKLLQGKKIERTECEATNCYHIDVNNYPSMQEMEDRAEILAKLLILYNKEDYPVSGDVGVGHNRRNNSLRNGIGGLHAAQGVANMFKKEANRR